MLIVYITVSAQTATGSEPARDGGRSGDIDGGSAGLITGKPAPTVFVWPLDHCGSELAYDGGGL